MKWAEPPEPQESAEGRRGGAPVRLDEDAVHDIRLAYTPDMRETLAERHGVSVSTIKRVALRTVWRDVPRWPGEYVPGDLPQKPRVPSPYEDEPQGFDEERPLRFYPADLPRIDMTDGGFAWTRDELEDAVNTAIDWLDAA